MNIQVRRVEYPEIEALRDLYRQEANCQIVRDSMLRRGLADGYLLLCDGQTAGYGGVMNKHDPGRLIEFYVLPVRRQRAQPMFRELLGASGATEIAAQTNLPLMLTMLFDFGTHIRDESVLFYDAFPTHLECPAGVFRHVTPEDASTLFAHHGEPPGDWLLEVDGIAVASGGFLCHYNPPYGDLYMEVEESWRRKGFGSYIIQELKRVCYEAGRRPAARCNVANVASRQTLQKAGMLPCARLLVGNVRENV